MARDPAVSSRPAVLGVDGYRGGWVGARVCDGEVEWLLLPDAEAVLEASTTVAATAVDAPIGLSEDGPRACDVAARVLLGARGVCVFPAPARPVLAATSYAEACELSLRARGVALSLQTWHITAKIRELDLALEGRPHAVVECHPEVSFTLMSGAVLAPKRTAVGLKARLVALDEWLDADAAMAALPSGPRRDDGLDALACAWTADRVRRGLAVRLPDGPLEHDRLGRPMQILG
ncbi:MAG: hypothetical protein QOJ92_1068 [Frankiales bacterium]|nr:hypothetical protein [Frankiales bacterium]